jgi:hypothetical protein
MKGITNMVTRRYHIGAVSVGILLTIMIVPTLLKSEGVAPIAASSILKAGKLGDWQFEYTISPPEKDGTTIITYTYPDKTKVEVEAATQAMRRTATQIAQRGTPFTATLIFTHPLSVEEFTAFVHTHHLTPMSSILRVVDQKSGEVGTVGAPPEWDQDTNGRFIFGLPKPGGEPIDREGLARFSNGRNPFRVVGVVSTDVILERVMYENLQRDNRVYAVDIMQQVLSEFVQHEPHVNLGLATIQGSRLYPAMEEAQIAPAIK